MLRPAFTSPESSHATAMPEAGHENPTTHTTTVKPAQAEPEHEEQLVKFNVPAMRINSESISSAMAARLAVSLLGHVLFLKSQVPFPVVQLSRIPGGQSNSRAAKKREELVNAIDTLSSHLQTTFTALSTAYALRQGRQEHHDDSEAAPDLLQREKAHIAFVLGSSVGAPKARVILAMDGLEVKMWGSRRDGDVVQGLVSDVGESDSDSESSSGSFSEDEVKHKEDQEDDVDDESASLPPSSRSPSPISRPSSPLTSVLNTPPISAPFRIATSPPRSVSEKSPPKSTKPAFKILSENSPPSAPLRRRPVSAVGTLTQKSVRRPLASSSRTLGENAPPRLRPTESISAPLARLSLSDKAGLKVSQPPALSFDEEQQVLRVADRLLSRTLANACAEDDGGFSDELAPTQTHVLLRAPRCFSHPAWLPRQSLTRTLDAQLQTFLEESIGEPSSDDPPLPKKKAQRQGVKTEGMWVTCAKCSPNPKHTINTYEVVHEDDEMIWWVWDGKIVGFSEW